MRRIRKGFTLLELLMVIMVIAILIGIALPRFRGMVEEGNIAKAKGELRTLQTAVESYYMHNENAYPALINGTELTGQTPAIVSVLPSDPFSATNYGYLTSGNYYAIWSVGPLGTGNVTAVNATDVSETAGTSCIYVSNSKQDTQP